MAGAFFDEMDSWGNDNAFLEVKEFGHFFNRYQEVCFSSNVRGIYLSIFMSIKSCGFFALPRCAQAKDYPS